jgi:hypothetical protein
VTGDGGPEPENEEEEADEFTIDFIAPLRADKLALQAKDLLDQGLMVREIGEKLGVSANHAGRLLRRARAILGIEIPDGRAVYRRVTRKRREAAEQDSESQQDDTDEPSDSESDAAE